jgi:hypothetical protein
MAEPTKPRPAQPADAGSGETTRTFLGGPAKQPAQPPAEPERAGPPAGIVRHGPGVPAPAGGDQVGQKVEQIWRVGLPERPSRPRPRLVRVLGSALTVLLLAATGVVLYLRLHHAPPFHVTGVAISHRTRVACAADVTGLITTNGGPGSVLYQWLVQPSPRQPRTATVSTTAGQHAARVTLILPLKAHGSATELVTLQVLKPDFKTASTTVAVSC